LATHVGQNPQDHVTLTLFAGSLMGYGPKQYDWQRNLPNGTVEGNGSFLVPSGHMLIVTDVDWHYNGGAPGSRQILRILLFPLLSPHQSFRHLESSIILDAYGDGGGSLSMTSGFAVAPETRIGVDTMPGPGSTPSTTGGDLSHAILRGYLTPT
jgi:hypothetical protein